MTTDVAATAKLSCNHVVTFNQVVAPSVRVGNKVTCDRCKRKADGSMPERTIKTLVRTLADTEPSDLVAAADERINDVLAKADKRLSEQAKAKAKGPGARKLDELAAKRAAKANPSVIEPGPTAKAKAAKADSPAKAAKRGSRTNAEIIVRGAKRAKADKANRAPKVRGKGNSAIRQQYLDAKKAVQAAGTRGQGTKLAPEAFTAHVAQLRTANPTETSWTLLGYAYWVEGLSFSVKTWDTAWAAAEQ
jgi:hypothetical protein